MDNKKVLELIGRYAPPVLSAENLVDTMAKIWTETEVTPKEQIGLGKITRRIKELEEEVKALRIIREQYERKFNIRMFANGEFEEIEA